jgi:leucyl aminopeptidase
MKIRFKSQRGPSSVPELHIIRPDQLETLNLKREIIDYIGGQIKNGDQKFFSWPLFPGFVFLMVVNDKKEPEATEARRALGASFLKEVRNWPVSGVRISCSEGLENSLTHVLEGIILNAYSFDKYQSPKASKEEAQLTLFGLTQRLANETKILSLCLQQLRDWINEPYNALSAETLAEQAKEFLEQAHVKVEVFGKKKITSLRMGGLLGVNQGSRREPRFVVARYTPPKAINKQPLVLVGKGVVFDMGGANLKTGNNMSTMKNDMSGAAIVLSALRLVAEMKLPLNIVALTPLTDNMVGPEGLVPGDVITLSDGTTVEVLNTDAEGRLILADALVYARHLNPMLVVDIATLTGAVVRSLGDVAAGAFEKGAPLYKKLLQEAAEATAERVVWFPLWKAYGDSLKSDVADLKNVGSSDAGHIVAAKFLENFTSYPWIHLDTAGVVYSEKGQPVRGKGATGWGLLLLKAFLLQLCRPQSHE